MSKYIYIFFFLGFIIGCGKESDLVGPVDSAVGNEPNWIALPSAENQALQKEISTGKWIYGDKRSNLRIRTSYLACTPFHFVSINAHAEFKKNSFEGLLLLQCPLVTSLASQHFTRYKFCKTGDLQPDYNSVDLSVLIPQGKFVTWRRTANTMRQSMIIMCDPRIGMLQVINAKLPHFSRYGFAN
jgi:hypothetical protein